MAGNAQVVVEFLAKTAGLTAGLKDVSSAGQDAGKSLGKLDWKSVAKWAGGAAALGASAKFIKDATRETTDLAKAAMQVSRTTGMDVQTSSAWVSVLKTRGIQTGQFTKSMTTLSKQMVAASSGSKKSSDAFAKLGVSMADVRSGDTQKVLMEAADGLAKIPNPAERAALAQQLFGRSGQALLPILLKGSKGIEDQLGMAEKYGAVISGKTAAQVADMAAKQREMQLAFSGVKVQLGSALIPILLALAQVLVEITRVIQPLITNGTVMKVVITALAAAFLAYKIAAAAAAIANLGLEASMLPMIATVGAVVVAIAALIAIGVLLYKNWDTISAAADKVWNQIQDAAKTVLDWLKANWPLILGILGGPIATAVVLIIRYWDQIKSATTAAWNAVKQAITSVLGAITSAVTSGFNAIKNAVTGPLAAVEAAVSAAWDQIKAAVNVANAAIQSAVTVAWNAVKSTISTVGAAIQSAATNAWNAVKSAVTSPLKAIENAVSDTWSALHTIVYTVGGAIRTAVEGNWNNIRDTIRALVNAIETIVTAAWNGIRTAIQAVQGPISSAIQAINGVIHTVGDAAQAAANVVKAAVDSIVGALRGAVGAAASAASAIASAIKGPINAVIGAWNSLSFTVPTVHIPGFEGIKIKGHTVVPGWGGATIGGGSWGFPNVPMLQKGGVLSQPTLFIGGEGRGREIVTPEALLRSILSEQRPDVRVYIGETELRGLVRYEVRTENTRTAQTLLAGLA